ncbi:uncharacterized protein RCC_01710 [Ramularia collo-cygni]|uniref:Uncharacterized protein n=1 Tax=Ramularia collo-cygni TaxID=112498 RepID=A0A2D3UM12_9PEZI|nr:uncharacterized protein RCC_01710 [Ramularia collo-cygni]CZT15872.1 uncharacterized protein RCC_01710 [Ramularia collo-cygni]
MGFTSPVKTFQHGLRSKYPPRSRLRWHISNSSSPR